MNIFRKISLSLLLLTSYLSITAVGIWDVYSFGAKGDGKTLDTEAIQRAIDDCHNVGGGKIVLHSGVFVTGTIQLKSFVTLYIESGAVLQGSDNPSDYPILSDDYPAVSGEFPVDKTLIYAQNAEHIGIAGNGTIDGRGEELEPMEIGRAHV